MVITPYVERLIGMQKREEVESDYDELIHTSSDAWLLRFDDVEYWFPQSQCDIDEEDKIITMPEWMAKTRGLI